MTNKNVSKPTVGRKQQRPRVQHFFAGIREPFVDDPTNKNVSSLTTGTNGQAYFRAVLSPCGIISVKLSGAVYTLATIDQVHLQWLNRTALGFGYYRVVRAKLVFVGNAGSTTQGTVNLFGSRDPLDCGTGINTAFMAGPYAKSVDLASASTKEISLPLPVDTSWKKVTSTVAMPGGVTPFYGDSSMFVPVNSVSDIAFGGVAAQVVGGPASVNVGNVFLDYDVEFRDPMSSALNA